MVDRYRQKLGYYGEELALNYLISKGYEPFGRNWRRRGGEIDLLVKKDDTLIFVEVKTRTTNSRGWGEDAVTCIKKRKIALAMDLFYQDNPELEKLESRVDIVVVELDGAKPKFVHFENIEM